MRWSLLTARSRCSIILHNGRSIRTARWRQHERSAVNGSEPSLRDVKRDAAYESRGAQKLPDKEPETSWLNQPQQYFKDANAQTAKRAAGYGEDTTDAASIAVRQRPIDDALSKNGTTTMKAKRSGGRPRVSDGLFERWSDGTVPPSHEQKIFANRFFTTNPKKLLFTAGKLYQVTHTDVPEIAFMGRSNVGKSTLLNALLGENVARVSAKPGKTRTLNAWAVGGMDRTGQKHKLTVLDMPGYGYGSRGEWGATVTKYLRSRKELKRVFVLVSAQHGLKESDKEMLAELRAAAIPHQVVLAKADALINSGQKEPTKEKVRLLSEQSNILKLILDTQPLIDSIRSEAAGVNRRRGALPAVNDILACSGAAGAWTGMPPEPQGSLGISALRWAIISATGLQPTIRVTDEKDLSF